MDTRTLLYLPVLAKPTKDSFDIRPKKVSEWVASLPRANIGEITRHVYQTLRIVNRLDIPTADRLRFLEQIDEPLQYISQSFTKHFLNLTFPLPEKRRKIIRLALDIDAEIALGYKIPMACWFNQGLKIDKKSAAYSIHRTLYYNNLFLEKYYQIYEPVPAGTWFEIHQLYLYAREQKVHEQKLEEPHNHHAPVLKTSIDELYKRILILALSQPIQLRQGEITKIALTLKDRWVNLVQWHTLTQNPPDQGLFIINPSSDTAPYYQAAGIALPPQCLSLDISALLTTLQNEITQTQGKDLTAQRLSTTTLDQDLLTRLQQTLQISHKRAYPRLKNNLVLDITIGLSCTHHYMTTAEYGQATAPPPKNTLEEIIPTADTKLSLSDIIYGRDSHNRFIKEAFPGVDTLQIDFESGAPVNPNPSATPAKPTWQQLTLGTENANKTAKKEERPAHFVIQQWVMTNLSAGGYGLMWDKNLESQAQVGELIGIHEQKNNRSHWSIGVIRWLRCRNDYGVEIGIQILAPEAKPVQVKLNNSPKADPFNGFLLPEIKAFKQPESLITPALPFQVNQSIQIITDNTVQPARLTRLLENTSNYRQFLFSPYQAPPTLVHKPTSHQLDKDNELDESIWSNL